MPWNSRATQSKDMSRIVWGWNNPEIVQPYLPVPRYSAGAGTLGGVKERTIGEPAAQRGLGAATKNTFTRKTVATKSVLRSSARKIQAINSDLSEADRLIKLHKEELEKAERWKAKLLAEQDTVKKLAGEKEPVDEQVLEAIRGTLQSKEEKTKRHKVALMKRSGKPSGPTNPTKKSDQVKGVAKVAKRGRKV